MSSLAGWILVFGFLFGFFLGIRDVALDYGDLEWDAVD